MTAKPTGGVRAPEPDQTAARVRDALGAEWHSSYTSDGLSVCVKFGCVGEHEDGCPFAALDSLVAERDSLREALEAYADHRHWGITRDDLRHPYSEWIGPGADERPVPNPTRVAVAALSAVAPPPPQEPT